MTESESPLWAQACGAHLLAMYSPYSDMGDRTEDGSLVRLPSTAYYCRDVVALKTSLMAAFGLDTTSRSIKLKIVRRARFKLSSIATLAAGQLRLHKFGLTVRVQDHRSFF